MTDNKYLDTWSNPNIWTQAEEPIGDLSFTVPAPGVNGVDPATLALWFDVSHWNTQPDSFFKEAVAKLDLAGLIVKISDGKQMIAGNSQDIANYVDDKAHRFIQLAYDLDIPCLVYHYYQPSVPQSPTKETDWQYRAIDRAIGNLGVNKSYYGIVLDAEEKTDTPPNISREMRQMWAWLTDDAKYGQVKRPWYTSLGYLNWCVDLRTWLERKDANQDLWLAQWPFPVGTKVTFETFKDLYKQIAMKVMTPGFATWRWLQWAVVNIGGGALDVNFYHGTKEQCYAWLGYKKRGVTPDPEPEPEPEPEPNTEYVTREEFESLRKTFESHTHATTTPV